MVKIKKSLVFYFLLLLVSVSTINALSGYIIIYYSVSIFLLSGYIIISVWSDNLSKIEKTVNKDILILYILIIAILISNINLFFYDSNYTITEVIKFTCVAIMPITLIIAFYYLYDEKYERYLIFLSVITLFFILTNAIIDSQLYFEQRGRLVAVNWSNVANSMLPILLLTRKTKLKILVVSLVLLVLFISMKRSGILFWLIFFSFIFFRGLYFAFAENRFRLSSKAILSIVFLCLVSVSFYVTDYFYAFKNRIVNLGHDQGSGRLEIWSKAIEIWENSSVFNLLFGYGYGAYSRLQNSSVDINASHNDFLDFILNYGLVGLFIFVLFFIKISYYFLKKITISNKLNFFFFGAVVANLIVYSLVSGVFHFSNLFLFLFLSIAVLLRKQRACRL